MFGKVVPGIVAGMALGALALFWADSDLSTTSGTSEAVAPAKPFLGPSRGNADPLETVGNDWLGVHARHTDSIKMGHTTAPFEIGAGTIPARGGPGSPWGPVNQYASSAKTHAGPAADSRLFAVTPTEPLAATRDRRARRSEPGSSLNEMIPPGPPRAWRWDIGY